MDTRATSTIDARLSELVQRLVDAVQPKKIYLFGSRARGDAQAGSDYDVLLLVADEPQRLGELEAKASKALWGYGDPVDVLVMNIDHFERRRVVRTSLPGTVALEGKLLYVA